jgi:hypothetical protein
MDNLLCIQQYKFSLFVCTFVDDGYLKEFIAKTRTMSPEERGAHLEKDEGITEAHEGSAQEGQTEVYNHCLLSCFIGFEFVTCG